MGSQTDKLELDPEVMYANVEEKRYKAELELLDRYLKFAEELLRLALLGIAVFGFLYQYDVLKFRNASVLVRIMAGAGVLAFGVSAFLALKRQWVRRSGLCAGTRVPRPPESLSRPDHGGVWVGRCLEHCVS